MKNREEWRRIVQEAKLTLSCSAEWNNMWKVNPSVHVLLYHAYVSDTAYVSEVHAA
jgi:hypothetical protein